MKRLVFEDRFGVIAQYHQMRGITGVGLEIQIKAKKYHMSYLESEMGPLWKFDWESESESDRETYGDFDED